MGSCLVPLAEQHADDDADGALHRVGHDLAHDRLNRFLDLLA